MGNVEILIETLFSHLKSFFLGQINLGALGAKQDNRILFKSLNNIINIKF